MKSIFNWGESALPGRSITIPSPPQNGTVTSPPVASPIDMKSITSEDETLPRSNITYQMTKEFLQPQHNRMLSDDDDVSELTAHSVEHIQSKKPSKKKSKKKWKMLKPLLGSRTDNKPEPPSPGSERRDVDESTHVTGQSEQRSAASSLSSGRYRKQIEKAERVKEFQSTGSHQSTSGSIQLSTPIEPSEQTMDTISSARKETDEKIKMRQVHEKTTEPESITGRDEETIEAHGGQREKKHEVSRNPRAQQEMDALFVKVLNLTDSPTSTSAGATTSSAKLNESGQTADESAMKMLTSGKSISEEKISSTPPPIENPPNATKNSEEDSELQDTISRARMLLARRRKMTDAISGIRLQGSIIPVVKSNIKDGEPPSRALHQKRRTLKRAKISPRAAEKQALAVHKMLMPILEDRAISSGDLSDDYEMDEIECGRASPIACFTEETRTIRSSPQSANADFACKIISSEEDEIHEYFSSDNDMDDIMRSREGDDLDDIESGRLSPTLD